MPILAVGLLVIGPRLPPDAPRSLNCSPSHDLPEMMAAGSKQMLGRAATRTSGDDANRERSVIVRGYGAGTEHQPFPPEVRAAGDC